MSIAKSKQLSTNAKYYIHAAICFRIPYDVLINDLETAIKSQVSPREAQMTLAEFDYNVYHPFEEVANHLKLLLCLYSSRKNKV